MVRSPRRRCRWSPSITNAGNLPKVFTAFWKQWSNRHTRSTAEAGSARIASYPETLDRPAIAGTSLLSTALRFGTISPVHLVELVGTDQPGALAFVRQLAWRDWHAHTAAENLENDRKSLRQGYDRVSNRRRRHARAPLNSADAQLRTDDRSVVPGQGSADQLATRRTVLSPLAQIQRPTFGSSTRLPSHCGSTHRGHTSASGSRAVCFGRQVNPRTIVPGSSAKGSNRRLD